MAWGMLREGSVQSRRGVHGAEGCRAGTEPVSIHALRRSQPGGTMEWPHSNRRKNDPQHPPRSGPTNTGPGTNGTSDNGYTHAWTQ
eukprot:17429-Prymnesium_polylepis.1